MTLVRILFLRLASHFDSRSWPRIVLLDARRKRSPGRKAEEFAMRGSRPVLHLKTYLHVSRVGRWRNYFSRFYEAEASKLLERRRANIFAHWPHLWRRNVEQAAWPAAFQRWETNVLSPSVA